MIQTEYETLRRNIRERTDKRERERERGRRNTSQGNETFNAVIR